MAQLQSVIPAAIREWQAAGATPSQIQTLENAQFEIADLPPTYLGWTVAPEAGAQAQPGLVVLDGLELRELDYVDVGEVLLPSRVVPMVVKSLAFGSG